MNMLLESAPQMIELDYDSFFRIPRPQRNEAILKSLLQPAPVPLDKIIYGHFFPIKYVGATICPDLRLVTVLRDPIERLKSNYTFWNSGDFPNHYLWRRMKEEKWAFEDYAFSAELRNVYSQFFAHISLGAFSYIGLYEDLKSSVRQCFEILEIPYPGDHAMPHVNVTPAEIDINVGASVEKELREYHSDDYLIFEYAKEKFHAEASPQPRAGHALT